MSLTFFFFSECVRMSCGYCGELQTVLLSFACPEHVIID